ncbi:MAG: aminotransferase class I/II-fold pyridoxal phosphate-dependent enzyme [Acidobacteria bacterium]|nr:aminotransferase class I/II-fold pyridoxal phosphate-dependent enzyme [Acidobacteriota bacterium]
MTALLGAVGGGAPSVAAAANALAPGGKYDFDTPYNRFGTNSIKYDSIIRQYGKDSIQVGMGIADMDFRAAPSITKALKERLEHENWGYLDMPAAFAEGVIAWNKKHYGVTIPPEDLIITMGVHPGLIATLKTFSPVGTKVLLQTPTYNGFYGDLRASDTLAEEVLLKRLPDGRFAMDFDAFEKQISIDTNSFILCNPQNPTGNCWSAEDLLRIGEICLKHRVVVLADEIHCDWVAKGQKYTAFASLPNKAVVDNSITFKAASKSFGLAAHKVAWFYSTNKDFMTRIRVNHRADLNTLGLIANMGAYTPDGEEWLSQAVDYVDANTDFAVDYVNSKLPGVKAMKPQGTYLMWLDFTEFSDKIGTAKMAADYNRTKAANAPTLSKEQMLERYLVKNARVHLNAGQSYGKGSDNFMRMNISTSRKTIELALTNLATALNKSTSI